jgi:hypothetical protein
MAALCLGCGTGDASVPADADATKPLAGDAPIPADADATKPLAGDAPIPADAEAPAADLGPMEADLAEVDDAPEVTQPPEPDTDLTESMFDPERLLEVDITLDPADWEALRYQTRSVFSLFGPGCMDGPFASPFTFFPATVSVDGEPPLEVGVRKKGFLGSMDSERPSLKVKFGSVVPDQVFHDLKRMTLNNSLQDPSLQRQCLAYTLFRDAGLVAPRCNWARVTVNGDYLGVYVHVDSLKRPFITRNFPDDTGTLWEGTLSDFRPELVARFEQKLNKETDDAAGLWGVVTAMEASDAQLFEALDGVIDLAQFNTFWAMEVLTGHWDGYAGNTNNFYVYERPDDDNRLTFIPWGPDTAFMSRPAEGGVVEPASIMAAGALARRLYEAPTTRAAYLARLQSLLDAVWDDDALLGGIAARNGWLAPHVREAEQARFVASTSELEGFVAAQQGRLESEVGGVDWPHPPSIAPCLSPNGELEGSYQTTWGTLETTSGPPPGEGTLSVLLGGEPLAFTTVVATAGAESDEAVVAIVGWVNATELYILTLRTELELFVPGVTLPLDWLTSIGHLLYFNVATQTQPVLVGMVGDGSWTIDEAGQGTGATVTGTVTGTVFALPED